MNVLALLALSLSPGVAIILFIYFQDKYEHEPWKTLSLSFSYGVFSLALAYVFSKGFDTIFELERHDMAHNAFRAFILVALLEESLKFFFLRAIIYYNKNFDEPFDGIVYSVMIGMGFATAENIAYVFTGGFEVALVRMFSAVPAHATFAILMGYFVGKAKFLYFKIPENETSPVNLVLIKNWFRGQRWMLGLLGLVLAVLAHGVYNYFLFISYMPGLWVGSFITLGLAIYFSKMAMEKQMAESPFRDD
jgi:RsiW-degrading membrane proteinase PrsW (M82 family)